MISYLNSDWQPADGGELMIHQENRNQNYARKERLFFLRVMNYCMKF
jgi:Rps23 Pro-64 3,4-dihydroxylase Tpa1-like proline 4-hydroxylase